MKITDVRVKKIIGEETGRLKAYVDLTFDEAFVIHGLKLIEGESGKFIATPSRKMPDGEFKDIVHPFSPELRKEITRSEEHTSELQSRQYLVCRLLLET